MQHQTLNLAGKQMEFAVSNFGTKEDTVRVASSSSKFTTSQKNFFLIKRFKSRSWSKTERARPEGSRERNLTTFLKKFSDYYLRFFSAKRGNRRRPRISRRRQRHCELYFKAYVENLVSFRES